MKKLLQTGLCAAALALSGLAGCGSACQDLADRLCECEPGGTLRDNCKSAAKNQIGGGAQQPTEADQARCQGLLGTCVNPTGPFDQRQLCDYAATPAGKVACGIAN